MLRVSTNFVTTTAINDLRRLSEEQARLHQTIATGRRLLKPSDDPAATSRVLNRQMEAERVGNYQSAASMAKSTCCNAAAVMTSSAFSRRSKPMPPVSTRVYGRPCHSASAMTRSRVTPG